MSDHEHAATGEPGAAGEGFALARRGWGRPADAASGLAGASWLPAALRSHALAERELPRAWSVEPSVDEAADDEMPPVAREAAAAAPAMHEDVQAAEPVTTRSPRASEPMQRASVDASNREAPSETMNGERATPAAPAWPASPEADKRGTRTNHRDEPSTATTDAPPTAAAAVAPSITPPMAATVQIAPSPATAPTPRAPEAAPSIARETLPPPSPPQAVQRTPMASAVETTPSPTAPFFAAPDPERLLVERELRTHATTLVDHRRPSPARAEPAAAPTMGLPDDAAPRAPSDQAAPAASFDVAALAALLAPVAHAPAPRTIHIDRVHVAVQSPPAAPPVRPAPAAAPAQGPATTRAARPAYRNPWASYGARRD